MENSTNGTTAAACAAPSAMEVSLVFLFIIAVFAIVGNALVCAAFATNKRLRILTNYYVVSLAVSDILVGSINIPMWMYIRSSDSRWCESESLQEIYSIFDILCGTASIWNMTAISIDRLAAVVYPTVYKHRMKNTQVAGWTILFVWTLSTFIAALRLQYLKFNYAMFVVTLSFFIPLVIILFSYGNIYRVVRYRAKWTGSVLMEIKLARTLSIVIGAFILCWGPFFVLNIVSYYCREKCDYLIAITIIKWLQYASSCINPIIYTIRNREFSFTFHKLVFRCQYRNGKYTFNARDKSSSTWCSCCQLGGPSDMEFTETRTRYPTYTEDSAVLNSNSAPPSATRATVPLGFENLSLSK